MKTTSPSRLPLALSLGAASVMLLLLGLPTLVLLWRSVNPGLLSSLLEPAALSALRLSLITTGASMLLLVVFGTPLAYALARHDFRGKRLLEVLVDLPLVLPPVVAGVALLLVFGRQGFLGAPLYEAGFRIAFTSLAVVLAQLFVAGPLYIRAMKAGFLAVPERLEAVSLTLGKSRWETLRRVTLPLTRPYLVEGLVLAWARALGEFGATIVFAGSLAGRTRTMPLAIYAALESDLDAALALSALLAVTAFALLFIFRLLTQGNGQRP